ncbi:MAG: hypothetical protein RR847_00415 [Bacilli bacterium]
MGKSDIKKNRIIKLVVIFTLCFMVIGLSVAYATLSATLNISGNATAKGGTWSVGFVNTPSASVPYNNAFCVVTNGSAVINTQPTVSNSTVSGFKVTLTKPGDEVKCKFDIKNNGTLGATLNSRVVSPVGSLTYTGTSTTKIADETLVKNNLIFTATGTNTTVGNTYAANSGTGAEELTIGYSSAATSVPTNDVEISGFSLNLGFVQS